MKTLHVNDGNDRPFCSSRSKNMTADSDESNCKKCHKAIAAKWDLWNNNEIQFARLLCELVANCDNLEFDAVCASMDLSKRELMSLYDRANDVWERSKAKHCPPPSPVERAEDKRKSKLAARIEAEAKAGNPLFKKRG